VRIVRGEIVGAVAEQNQRATATDRAWLDVVPVQARA
jgi:hypothetical protein